MPYTAYTISDIKSKLKHLLTLDKFNNDNCEYTGPAGEHCIVGQLLSDMGIKPPAYGSEHNGSEFSNIPQAVHFANEVTELLEDIQFEADSTGETWGVR